MFREFEDISINKAAKAGQEFKADFVLAFGGGSVMGLGVVGLGVLGLSLLPTLAHLLLIRCLGRDHLCCFLEQIARSTKAPPKQEHLQRIELIST